MMEPLRWYHKAFGEFVLITFFRPAKWCLFDRIDSPATGCAAILFSISFWLALPIILFFLLRLAIHA